MNYLLAPFLLARLLASVAPLTKPTSSAAIVRQHDIASTSTASKPATDHSSQNVTTDPVEAKGEHTSPVLPFPVADLLAHKDQIFQSFAALVQRVLPNTYTDTGASLCRIFLQLSRHIALVPPSFPLPISDLSIS